MEYVEKPASQQLQSVSQTGKIPLSEMLVQLMSVTALGPLAISTAHLEVVQAENFCHACRLLHTHAEPVSNLSSTESNIPSARLADKS